MVLRRRIRRNLIRTGAFQFFFSLFATLRELSRRSRERYERNLSYFRTSANSRRGGRIPFYLPLQPTDTVPEEENLPFPPGLPELAVSQGGLGRLPGKPLPGRKLSRRKIIRNESRFKLPRSQTRGLYLLVYDETALF